MCFVCSCVLCVVCVVCVVCFTCYVFYALCVCFFLCFGVCVFFWCFCGCVAGCMTSALYVFSAVGGCELCCGCIFLAGKLSLLLLPETCHERGTLFWPKHFLNLRDFLLFSFFFRFDTFNHYRRAALFYFFSKSVLGWGIEYCSLSSHHTRKTKKTMVGAPLPALCVCCYRWYRVFLLECEGGCW